MAWTTPILVEICIGLEINGYLPAEFWSRCTYLPGRGHALGGMTAVVSVRMRTQRVRGAEARTIADAPRGSRAGAAMACARAPSPSVWL